MAATLVLSNSAKALVVAALREDLTHVYLSAWQNINLDQTLTDSDIKNNSSDGSSRVKQLRINPTTTEYRTENSLEQNDESRITNFYIIPQREANNLVLMDGLRNVKGIITFTGITPTEDKSLYVPEIKINVL